MANQTEEKNHEIIVEMKNIDMRFQGVHALDDVSITLRRGEAVSYTHLTLPTNSLV